MTLGNSQGYVASPGGSVRDLMRTEDLSSAPTARVTLAVIAQISTEAYEVLQTVPTRPRHSG